MEFKKKEEDSDPLSVAIVMPKNAGKAHPFHYLCDEVPGRRNPRQFETNPGGNETKPRLENSSSRSFAKLSPGRILWFSHAMDLEGNPRKKKKEKNRRQTRRNVREQVKIKYINSGNVAMVDVNREENTEANLSVYLSTWSYQTLTEHQTVTKDLCGEPCEAAGKSSKKIKMYFLPGGWVDSGPKARACV
ncbi:hypothetical protein RUM43_006344 [Polyplax serrata]|uniref:Uncharacterized protein n=1 Tax=Polyplax serrata TaxID=468196 RepID=A0AAN8PL39_POLSC